MAAVTRSLLPYSPGMQPRAIKVAESRASDGPSTLTSPLGRQSKVPVTRAQMGMTILRVNNQWNPRLN